MGQKTKDSNNDLAHFKVEDLIFGDQPFKSNCLPEFAAQGFLFLVLLLVFKLKTVLKTLLVS